MDPNQNLRHLRAYAKLAQNIRDACPENGEYLPEQWEKLAELAEQMAEHFQALDDWLKTGGFLPSDWQRA